MKRIIKAIVLSAITFILVLNVCGCSKGEEAAITDEGKTISAELPVIKISFSPSDFHLDVLVAIEKKYFEDAGIKVELVQVSNSLDALALIARNDVEGIFLNSPSILSAFQEKVKIKPVCGIGNREFALITRKDSTIQSIEDLDGKKLSTGAYGAGPWFAVMCDIEEYGLNLETIPMSSSDSIAALLAGNIDAMTGGASNISLYPDELRVFHICHQSKYIWNSCSWCFTEKFLAEQPALVEKFIVALTPAREYIKADTLGALQILSKYSRVDPETMMQQTQLPIIPDFPIPPALYIQGFYKVNELMVKYGYLDAPIDVDAHMDTRFATPLYEY